MDEEVIEPGENSSLEENRFIQVLVVDDLKVNYLLIKAMLGNLNASIYWAENGFLAIDYIREGNEVDIVLMDYNMPGMNGVEATFVIKEIRPNLPVISLSTFTDSKHFDRKAAPFDGYITKPVEPEMLYRAIENLIAL